MKNLKFLQQELLSKTSSSRLLNSEEKKNIQGGYGHFDSKSECKKYCGGSDYHPGVGVKIGKGICYVSSVSDSGTEYWDCRDS